MLRTLALVMLALQPSRMAPATVGWPQADDLKVKLNLRVSNYNPGTFSLVGGLIRVSNDFHIPMGITWVNSPSARAQMPFAWKDATVLEVIEGIAKTQPGYEVQVSNGVVHVFPSNQIPDRENFLKLKIGTFETHNTLVELASFKLHMLVTPIRGNHQISVAGPGDSKVDLELKDTSVETALDALLTASNRKIWVVTFADDPSLTPRGLRRAMSLWSEKAGPDEGQPAWDLLRWGDPLPPLVTGAPPPQVR